MEGVCWAAANWDEFMSKFLLCVCHRAALDWGRSIWLTLDWRKGEVFRLFCVITVLNISFVRSDFLFQTLYVTKYTYLANKRRSQKI